VRIGNISDDRCTQCQSCFYVYVCICVYICTVTYVIIGITTQCCTLGSSHWCCGKLGWFCSTTQVNTCTYGIGGGIGEGLSTMPGAFCGGTRVCSGFLQQFC